MRGLPPHRRLPGYSEPGQILIDRGLELRPAAGEVDIFDPQQKSSAGLAREIEVPQRRISVAEMEIAVRARRKSENGWRHDGSLVMPGLAPGIHVLQQCREKSMSINDEPMSSALRRGWPGQARP